MEILQVIDFFKPAWDTGGIVRVCYEISRRLINRGHEVTVYTTDGRTSDFEIVRNRQTYVDGIRTFYFKNLSYFLAKRNICLPYFLPAILKKEIQKYDLIHIHTYRSPLSIPVHYYARKYKIPYIIQTHGSTPRIIEKKRLKLIYDLFFGYRLLKDASKVIALSVTETKHYREMGVSKNKIAIVPNGIDLSEYADLPPKGAFKEKFNIPLDKKIILYLGRIHKSKRIDFLVKAYAHMVKDMKYNDSILVIAGPNDGYIDEIKSLASSFDIYDKILFTGFISNQDKIKAFVDGDVFITPSFFAFPMTFLEACATGTPIITTNLGDTLKWIDGNVGYITSPKIIDLAEAIYKVISDYETRETFSRNCKKLVKSKFSLKIVIEKLEQLYREIVGDFAQ